MQNGSLPLPVPSSAAPLTDFEQRRAELVARNRRMFELTLLGSGGGGSGAGPDKGPAEEADANEASGDIDNGSPLEEAWSADAATGSTFEAITGTPQPGLLAPAPKQEEASPSIAPLPSPAASKKKRPAKKTPAKRPAADCGPITTPPPPPRQPKTKKAQTSSGDEELRSPTSPHTPAPGSDCPAPAVLSS